MLLQFSAACTEMGQKNAVSPQHVLRRAGKALRAGRMQLYTVALVPSLADHKPRGNEHTEPKVSSSQGGRGSSWVAVKNMSRAVPHLL